MHDEHTIEHEGMPEKTTRILTEMIERLDAEIVDDGNHTYALTITFDSTYITNVMGGSAGVVVAAMLDALRFMLPRLTMQSRVEIQLRDGSLREFPGTVR